MLAEMKFHKQTGNFYRHGHQSGISFGETFMMLLANRNQLSFFQVLQEKRWHKKTGNKFRSIIISSR